MYDLEYHPVWTTRHRKKVPCGQVAECLRDLVRRICKTTDMEIITGSISKDHIHLFMPVPPHLSISRLIQSFMEYIANQGPEERDGDFNVTS
jgi:putative transposase